MRRPPSPWLAALALLALAASPARAQNPRTYDVRNLAFRGAGAEVGWILPARSEPTPLFGVRGDLGFLGPGLRIVPRFAFWSSTLNEGEVRGLAERIQELCEEQGGGCPLLDLGEVRISDMVLAIDAHAVWETALGVDTYLGLGAGAHLLNGQGEAIDGTFVEKVLDAITPGLDLVAGAELPLGPLRVFGEGRAVLASEARWVGVSVGGAVDFGGPPPRAVPPPPPPAPDTTSTPNPAPAGTR